MKRFLGMFNIRYSWRRAIGNGSVLDRHTGYLEDEAWLKSKQQMGAGKFRGRLSLNIKVDPKDGPDGVSYVGHWEIDFPEAEKERQAG